MSALDKIQARVAAATPGPWKALGTGVVGGDHWYVCDDGQSLASIASNDGDNEDQRRPDAEFIAHARMDVPRLVHALRQFEKWADAMDEHAEILNLDPHSVAAEMRKKITEALA